MKKITALILAIMFCLCPAVTVKAYDTTAPILTVSNIDSTSNRLEWTKVDGAESYVIYILNKDTDRYEKYSAEIKGTSCNDIQLLPNTEYTYKVQPKFPDGSVGKMSDSRGVYTRNKYGNSFYNALQGKNDMTNIYAAVQGEWIYFSVCPTDQAFINENSGYGNLYKIKTDGTNFQLIKNKCFASYINATGDRLYYIDITKNGWVYTVMSCDLDGKNTEIIAKDNELDGYDHWDSYSIRNLEIIDDQMLFNVSALEGWYDGNNIYALDLTNREKPVDFAGFGDEATDNFSDDWTEEDEIRYMKDLAEKRAQYAMSKGMFTDEIMRAAYQSYHLEDVPAVEKCLEPQQQWLYNYNRKLYLCNENEYKLISSNFSPDNGSALMYEDTVYYKQYDQERKISCLFKYEDGTSTELYSEKNTGYKIFYADSSRMFFIKEVYKNPDERVSLGIYSINTDGSDLKRLWQCKYPRYKG